jgi:hypothetical protein
MPIQIKLWTAKRVVRLACWNKKELIFAAIFIGATRPPDRLLSYHQLAERVKPNENAGRPLGLGHINRGAPNTIS